MTEKELLVVVYALKKIQHYITGYSIFVHIDHATIKYLMNKPTIIGRLARWLLLLQELDITTIDPVPFKLLVNGHRLKLYKWSQTKEDFLQ